jgi:hypothetical protein
MIFLTEFIIDVVFEPCECTISGFNLLIVPSNLKMPKIERLDILLTCITVACEKYLEIDGLQITVTSLFVVWVFDSSSTCCSIPAKVSLKT